VATIPARSAIIDDSNGATCGNGRAPTMLTLADEVIE
jgi:hypothetical protein